MVVGQAKALRIEQIQGRGLQNRISMARQIPVTLIVSDDEYHVGLGGLLHSTLIGLNSGIQVPQ